MKKIILLAAAALFTTGAFAQSFREIERGTQWGIKAGVNLADVTKIDDTKMRVGFYAGVFGEYVMSDYFGIQAELLYSQMGMMFKDGDVKEIMKTDYLTLPILAKLYPLRGLSVDLGPQFGLLLSAKDKLTGSDDDSTSDVKNAYKDIDVSWAIGLSYKIADRFDVSARYNIGLTRLFDNDTDSDDLDKAKNSVVMLGVGYRF